MFNKNLLLCAGILMLGGCFSVHQGVPEKGNSDLSATGNETLYEGITVISDNATTLEPAHQVETVDDKHDEIEPGSAKNGGYDQQFHYRNYRFQVGDKIEISVWGEPDMTREVVVLPDGTVSYFLIGEIQAVGKTFMELREELEKRLSKYILDPSVTIIGKSFAGTFATILGAVKKPGRHAVAQTDRVLDVISKAGGLRYVTSFGYEFTFAGHIANLKLAYLSRKGQMVDIDFVALIDYGDMLQNIPIQVGDFIYIPSSFSDQIYVLGEVRRPTTVPYSGRTSLLEAIASAGGFVETTACKRSVCIVRGSLKDTEVMRANFPKILKGKENNIMLEPGDIVYVPSTFITDVERLSAKIIPFLEAVIGGDEVIDIGQRRWKTWNPYKGR